MTAFLRAYNLALT